MMMTTLLPSRTHRRRLAAPAGAVGVAIVLAACGSAAPAPTRAAGTTGSSASPATAFGTARVPGLGTVVVDGKGRTVYVLTADGRTNAPCTDASGCTALWPDLPLPRGVSAARAGSGIRGSLLGTTELRDGETYPTYDGWLMYEYAGDTGPGRAGGQGIRSFGGTWYALDGSGHPLMTSASQPSGGAY